MRTQLEHEIQQLLKFHRHGFYTWREIVAQFCDLSLSPGFFECVPSLPEEIVSELRQTALHAPAHPEDVLIVQSYCGPLTGPEYEDSLTQQRVRCYWSARKLREFFFPGLEIPPFEVIKFVGRVEESVLIGDLVILFGEFQGWLIRTHPVYCITPRSQKVPVTVVDQGKTKHKHEDSPDSIVRKYGRPSLSLDATDLRPDHVPASSTVWVDRTDTTSIPGLELSPPSGT